MKIYLASRYSRRDELRLARTNLIALGHTVTSGWLDTEWPGDERGSTAAPPEFRERFALKDMADVAAADVVVSFTEEPRSGGRGGRHVEFGMAAAWGKRLVVVGGAEHIFHHLPAVKFVGSIAELCELLRPSSCGKQTMGAESAAREYAAVSTTELDRLRAENARLRDVLRRVREMAASDLERELNDGTFLAQIKAYARAALNEGDK